MPEKVFNKPVEDSIPKVDKTVAVGEDLEFQEKWWKFERIVWSFFALVLVMDLLGVFGRGWVAKAHRQTPDGTMDVKYERIERTMTPSTIKIRFGAGAIRNGHVQLFVSNSVVSELGALRIAPQPEASALSDGGITYSFPAQSAPAAVDISMAPPVPGVHKFTLQVPGADAIQARVVVVP